MSKTFLSVFWILSIFLSGCQVSQAVPLPTFQPSPTQIHAVTNKKQPTIVPNPTPEPSPTLDDSVRGDQKITLMAVGDIMLGRTIGEMIESEGVEAPFLYTAETLSTADITLGNLECPISSNGNAEEKTYAFRAPVAAGKSLALAGFDVVSLANNHILDYGTIALEDTLGILTDHKIQSVGAGSNESAAYAPLFLEIDGLKVAVLAFADIPTTDYDYLTWEAGPEIPGIAWAHPEKVQKQIRAAKEKADVVIVLVHNGFEVVQTVSQSQQDFAHLAIDSGASLVIGSHPHVLQRIEDYHDGLIVYSMGNFVFDNFLFPPNYSAIFKAELTPEGVDSYELIDVVVQLNGVPQIMDYDFPIQ